MNRWKLALPVVAALVSLSATGCYAEADVEVRTPPQPVQVQAAPPPPQVEVAPAPRADYVWVGGHWDWTGARYVWLPGHYERQVRNARWVPAHYEQRGPVWYYIRGHWAR
jgi:hypothetical protein